MNDDERENVRGPTERFTRTPFYHANSLQVLQFATSRYARASSCFPIHHYHSICIAVMMAFFAARTGTTAIYGQGSGVYDHYFYTFLNPTDVIWSFFQSVAMTIVIMLVHTYYGYTATGGPAGVGEAVGRAVRTSMVVAAVEIVMISLAVYGQSGNFNLAG